MKKLNHCFNKNPRELYPLITDQKEFYDDSFIDNPYINQELSEYFYKGKHICSILWKVKIKEFTEGDIEYFDFTRKKRC